MEGGTGAGDHVGDVMGGVDESGKKRKLSDNSNGTEVTTPEELKKLLEPLSKEQLIALLADAASQFSAVADDIRDVASKDPAHQKLFVCGLAWETSSQALREFFGPRATPPAYVALESGTLSQAFEQYGEIEEGAVITDKASGKSRGFGFITFKHMDSAQRALKEPSKNIDVSSSLPLDLLKGSNVGQLVNSKILDKYFGSDIERLTYGM